MFCVIYFSRIEKLNGQFNAFVSINENFLKDAELIDQKILKGDDVGPMAGVPFGIKEMFCTQGIKTTAASKILNNFI